MIYTYDNTFDGFLSCVYLNYYHKPATHILPENSWQMNVLLEHQSVCTNEKQAQKVYYALHDKLTEKAVEDIFYVFLSSEKGKEDYLLQFIKLAFRIGPKIDNMYSHPDVLPVREIVYKVGGEKHRLMGLLRFRDTGSFLYADYAPDHDITGLLAPFFANRMMNERFIIHDVKRRIAAVYQQNNWFLTDFNIKAPLPITATEVKIQALWKHYFDTAAIESRRNPKLQRRCMPQRYWKFLTEMQYKSKPNIEEPIYDTDYLALTQ